MALVHPGGPWWPLRLVGYQVALLTLLLALLVKESEGQMAQYKLEVNEEAGSGIFVSYYQVLMGDCFSFNILVNS